MNTKYLEPLQRLTIAKYVLFTLIISYFVLYMPSAFAENPLKDIKIVSGQTNNNDIGAIFKFFIQMIATALPFVIMIFAFSDVILSVFSSLREARRDKEWGTFFFNLLMVLIAIAVSIILGSIIFTLLDKFADYWTF